MKTNLIAAAIVAGCTLGLESSTMDAKYDSMDGHLDAFAMPDDALLNMSALPYDIDPKYVAATLASFFAELIYINRLDSLEGCAVDSKKTIDEAIGFIKAIQAGEFDEAFAAGI